MYMSDWRGLGPVRSSPRIILESFHFSASPFFHSSTVNASQLVLPWVFLTLVTAWLTCGLYSGLAASGALYSQPFVPLAIIGRELVLILYHVQASSGGTSLKAHIQNAGRNWKSVILPSVLGNFTG